MSSVILMLALTAGADAPAFGRGHGCHSGGCGSSCYSGGCGYGCSSGGYGYGCYSGGCGYSGGSGYGCSSGGCGYASYPGGMMGAPGMYQVPEMAPKGATPKKTSLDAPAIIIVSLPEDAKLLVDDRPTISTSATRVLASPNLPYGREFYYTLKAEIVRDGKPVTVSREIAVEAGKQTQVTLSFDGARVAQR